MLPLLPGLLDRLCLKPLEPIPEPEPEPDPPTDLPDPEPKVSFVLTPEPVPEPKGSIAPVSEPVPQAEADWPVFFFLTFVVSASTSLPPQC